jgi:hypothetical protein
MNLTQEQIKEEFRRQVKLCSGLGKETMIQIIQEIFPSEHVWQPSFWDGTFCIRCGEPIGSNRSCK